MSKKKGARRLPSGSLSREDHQWQLQLVGRDHKINLETVPGLVGPDHLADQPEIVHGLHLAPGELQADIEIRGVMIP
jgi:hypothetical protein